MKIVALSEAKEKLSALVEEADTTHEIVQITRHGRPAAVLMSADDLESLRETLYWLSQPGTREDIAAARRDLKEGRTISGAELREQFNLPAVAADRQEKPDRTDEANRSDLRSER